MMKVGVELCLRFCFFGNLQLHVLLVLLLLLLLLLHFDVLLDAVHHQVHLAASSKRVTMVAST